MWLNGLLVYLIVWINEINNFNFFEIFTGIKIIFLFKNWILRDVLFLFDFKNEFLVIKLNAKFIFKIFNIIII